MSVARAVRPKGALYDIILLARVIIALLPSEKRSEAIVALHYVECVFGFDAMCNNFDFSRALCCRFCEAAGRAVIIILLSIYFQFVVRDNGINRISVKRAFQWWSYCHFGSF